MKEVTAPYQGPLPVGQETEDIEGGKSQNRDLGDQAPPRPDADIELRPPEEEGKSISNHEEVEAKKALLSFRALMGGGEPQYGLCFAADHRRNGYVRRGERGPWIRFENPKASALIAAAIYENTGVLPRPPDVQEVIDKLRMAV